MSTLDFIVSTGRTVLCAVLYTTTEWTEGIWRWLSHLRVLLFSFHVFIHPFDICISNLVDEVDVLFSVHEEFAFWLKTKCSVSKWLQQKEKTAYAYSISHDMRKHVYPFCSIVVRRHSKFIECIDAFRSSVAMVRQWMQLHGYDVHLCVIKSCARQRMRKILHNISNANRRKVNSVWGIRNHHIKLKQNGRSNY